MFEQRNVNNKNSRFMFLMKTVWNAFYFNHLLRYRVNWIETFPSPNFLCIDDYFMFFLLMVLLIRNYIFFCSHLHFWLMMTMTLMMMMRLSFQNFKSNHNFCFWFLIFDFCCMKTTKTDSLIDGWNVMSEHDWRQ